MRGDGVGRKRDHCQCVRTRPDPINNELVTILTRVTGILKLMIDIQWVITTGVSQRSNHQEGDIRVTS